MRDYLLDIDEDAKTLVLNKAIRDLDPGSDSEEERYRVTLQYPEVSEVLEAIGTGKGKDLSPGKGTRYRLVKAYKYCLEFLSLHFGSDVKEVGEFFRFVWRKAQVITIETENLRSAYRIFQTLNDRGRTLNASDLLKNVLFHETSDDKHAQSKVRESWREVLGYLQDADENNHVRFLRYYLMGSFDTGGILRASEIFSWLTDAKNPVAAELEANPVGFSQQLRRAAQAYSRFSMGRDQNDRVNPHLQGIVIQRLGVRQHLCLLLASRGLERPAFDLLADALEDMTLLFAIAKERWNVVERNLPDWTNQLRESSTIGDIEEFVLGPLRDVMVPLSERFWPTLDDMQRVPDALIKYMLARITLFVQQEAGLGGQIASLIDPRITIEHVLPQSTLNPDSAAGTSALDEFGLKSPIRAESSVYRLGNLVLMDWGDNSSMGPRPFSDKSTYFRKSPWLFTSSLAKDNRRGGQTKVNKIVAKYSLLPSSGWNRDWRSCDPVHRRRAPVVASFRCSHRRSARRDVPRSDLRCKARSRSGVRNFRHPAHGGGRTALGLGKGGRRGRYRSAVHGG
jgi:hypothetical protein